MYNNIWAIVTFRDGLLGLVPPSSVQGGELVSPPTLPLPLQSASAATIFLVINIVINIAVIIVIIVINTVMDIVINIVIKTAVVAGCQETLCLGHDTI